jgi:small-conductance mechanosensitive channel
MPYNLVEAGKAIGMGKSSVLRAIRKGVISASRDPTTGGWAIDPAELHRAFPAVANGTAQNQDGTAETDAMRELRARLADKDALIASLERTVEDLRRRLDTATAQLGEALQQVRLLTDQRPPATATAPARRS